jgi:hypothetical protein
MSRFERRADCYPYKPYSSSEFKKASLQNRTFPQRHDRPAIGRLLARLLPKTPGDYNDAINVQFRAYPIPAILNQPSLKDIPDQLFRDPGFGDSFGNVDISFEFTSAIDSFL